MTTPGRRYVVGYSGDKRSKDALRLGVALARASRGELDLVQVVRTDDPFQPVYPPVGDVTPIIRRQARTLLEEAARTVPSDVVARTHVREHESVAAGLVAAAEELGAGLVVVGAGGGAGRFAVGPVAGALLHSSTVPVALAPRRYRGDAPLTRLYTAVGTRPGAHLVIDEAVAAVERSGLELVLISFLSGEDGEDDGEARRAVQEHLERAAAEARRHHPVTVHVAGGRTLEQAARDVDWVPGGLLLIGSSRLARGRQTFLGTTAARLLKHIPVPMVVVPRPARTEEN